MARSNMMPVQEVGSRIRFLREINQYTRDEFADKIGVSSKFLYEIENGKKGFSVEILYKISKLLSVSTDYLIFGNSDQKISARAQNLLENFEVGQMQHVEAILEAVFNLCEKPGAGNVHPKRNMKCRR